jgi:NADH-quinone oxidoreductase subunit L
MVEPVSYLRWIVLFPALGFLWNVFFGRQLPASVKLVGPGAVLLAFATVVAATLQLNGVLAHADGHGHGTPMLLDHLYTWIQTGPVTVEAALRFDALSMVMCLVITGIGFLIHVYSVGYMHDDPDFPRFFTYLNLFITAMLILVLGDSLPLLFVGWEGVGLCSYLLIGFWYTHDANAAAGKKAFIVNRIGDASFILGMFILFWTVGTLEVAGIEAKVDVLKTATLGGWPVPLLVGLLLFGGATGKSAQIPLFVWLPDAMAGPTPVSALIHAATMVTAGIYMIIRMHFLYALAPGALTVVGWVGGLTALVAATIAVAQMDIKKVLAYSTVSQLGYMFLGLGVGVTGAALFHVVTHAFFKALLFLGAGSVIHGMHGEQDMGKMGGLKKHLPWTWGTMLVGTIAIAGVPPFSGFWSKDEIIWGAFTGPNANPALGVIGYGVALLTSFYMGRMFWMTFYGREQFDHHHVHPHESPWSMLGPLCVLAVLSAVGGWIPIPHILEHVIGHQEHHEAPLAMLAFATAIACAGLGASYYLYVLNPETPARLAASAGGLYRLLRDKWLVDELYDATVVRTVFGLSNAGAHMVDPLLIDGTVNGAGRVVAATSNAWRGFQSGNVQHYALSFVAGALALLGYYVTR